MFTMRAMAVGGKIGVPNGQPIRMHEPGRRSKLNDLTLGPRCAGTDTPSRSGLCGYGYGTHAV